MSNGLTARQVVINVMNDVQGVGKNDKNTQQGFNFRGIDAVLNAVGPALRKHGGFIVPKILSSETSIAPTKNGGAVNIVRLHVEYSVFGAEGEPLVGDVVSESMDSGDKSTAKALSVALRSFLIQLLALPTHEPDPDSQTYEIAAAVPAGPSVAELKANISEHFKGQPKTAITAALQTATGKASGWSADELAGFLDTLEAAK